ncbi:MAG TPA: hypothetical protein VK636_23620 [Gemmatimonadaceae bacterium]|nr:hypothetical protein [Gemmatimonadaceae bacterium]
MATQPGVNIPNSTDQGGIVTHINGTLQVESGGVLALMAGSVLAGVADQNIRVRATIAQVNAGLTLLPAVPGFKYRMISARAIAVGGAAGAVTTVDVIGTQAASPAKLAAFAQASLTQSTVLTAGGAGAAVLADGASFVQNDVNTAITLGKTGASVTTATAIDILLSYALEP